MPRLLPLLLLLAAAAAQAQQLDDPANLAGERTYPQSLADTLPINHGAPALQQLLLKLRTRASLMLIVAHPDDEDGGLLTFESRGRGARVAMLTLTRGEGGQNLMSADFNDALGLIRTQELLAADRYMGVTQFFGTEVDFGFSKTKEETLAQWTHDRVLYDAVRAVRLYRPLVLASVFVGGPTDGHGHHQVAGEISQEVFLAAADPKIFPEMNLPPWAPLAVYARVPFSRVTAEGMFDYATGKTIPPLFHNYVTNADSTDPPAPTVQIHEGDPALIAGAPALGMDDLTYVQFARQGLAQQKTQIGPGVRLPPPGRAESGYTLMAARACIFGSACPTAPKTITPDANPWSPEQSDPDLFQGIDTSLTALSSDPALPKIDALLAQAQQLFDPTNLELTAPPLRDALRTLDTLIAQTTTNPELLHELRIKRVQLNDALLLAHGLTLHAQLTDPGVAPLLTSISSLSATLTISDKSANSSQISSAQLTVNLQDEGIGTPPAGPLEPETSKDLYLRLPYLAGLAATKPYFSRPTLDQPFYDIAVPQLRNAPATPAPIVAHAFIDDQGVQLRLATVVPTPSHPTEPLIVVPRLSLEITPKIKIVPTTAPPPLSFNVDIRTNVPAADPRIDLDLPKTWTILTPPPTFILVHPGDTRAIPITVQPAILTAPVTLQAFASEPKIPGKTGVLFGYRSVGYPGLPYTNYYTPATLKAVPVDVITAPGLRVAYLPGTGDDVPAFLPNLGITPTLITPADLIPAKLAAFDTIVLGVRAYAAHPELAGSGSKSLLDFAAAGGTVIVQYNSASDATGTAPYPFTLPGDSAHNVVDESDPVQILAPLAPILNWPNHITSADFDHWSEERGHGFPASWDDHYQPLLETHDPGQDPQRGGLLLAPVGKGAYIYCAYAIYRQLPEGVPGSYRLLANLLSNPKNPANKPD